MAGRLEDALSMRQDVYYGKLKLRGEGNGSTLVEAYNFATLFHSLQRFEEAKALLRKTIPLARRAFGESHELVLKMRLTYAATLYENPDATLDDFREALATLEESEQTARRVPGGAHPLARNIEKALQRAQRARTALRARETPGS